LTKAESETSKKHGVLLKFLFSLQGFRTRFVVDGAVLLSRSFESVIPKAVQT
jgi:hypothetical protein